MSTCYKCKRTIKRTCYKCKRTIKRTILLDWLSFATVSTLALWSTFCMDARVFDWLQGCFLILYMLCHISLYISLNRNCLKFMLVSTLICVKLLLEVIILPLVKFSWVGGKGSWSMGVIAQTLQMLKISFRMCVTAILLLTKKLL